MMRRVPGDVVGQAHGEHYNRMAMTKLLEDAIAQIVLDEIDSERRWEELFAKSPEKLRTLADRAWTEHEAGGAQLV